MPRASLAGRLVVIVTTAALSAPAAAQAAPGDATDDSPRPAATQRTVPKDVAQARNRLVRLARQQPNHSGWTWQGRKQRLVLAGVGRPAKPVRRVIRRAERRTDITVAWRERHHTRAQLRQQARIARKDPRVAASYPAKGGQAIFVMPYGLKLLDAPRPWRALGLTVPVRVWWLISATPD